MPDPAPRRGHASALSPAVRAGSTRCTLRDRLPTALLLAVAIAGSAVVGCSSDPGTAPTSESVSTTDVSESSASAIASMGTDARDDASVPEPTPQRSSPSSGEGSEPGPEPDRTSEPGASESTAAPSEDPAPPSASGAPTEEAVSTPSSTVEPPTPPCSDASGRVFDYRCSTSDPDSCPDGLCVLGQCIAPVVDPARWDDCGDGVCDPCAPPGDCPADCVPPSAWAPAPRVLGARDTLTVYVHGFRNAGDQSRAVYGEARSPGSLGRTLLPWVDDVADGVRSPDAPRQLVGVGYYGRVPAEHFTPEDVAEIDAFDLDTPEALHRYALIVARFVTRRLERSGSDAVQLACHSMGCHVIRYMIENDLDQHASSGRITRWMTSGGVVAGARLARLYDNPTVRDIGGLIGINTVDFIHMNPDHVQDHSAIWDRRLWEANNPRFGGMLIHHVAGTDPRLSDTANIIRLLDLNNPDDEPNDGIVYTFDQFFHAQNPEVSARTVEGHPRPPTRSFLHREHFDVSDDDGTGVLAAAALYHHRKVRISVTNVTVLDDLEQSGPLDFRNQGTPPAELIFHVRVRFDPWVVTRTGREIVVHESTQDHRTAEVFEAEEDVPVVLGYTLFEGPVLDDMDELWMEIEALETDCYPRFDVFEWCFGSPARFLRHRGQFAIEDHERTFENDRIRFTVRVEVDHFSE